MKMDQIGKKEVMAWQEARLGQGIKGSTINRGKQALMACLNSAVESGYLDENRVKGVKNLRVEQEHVVRWLSEDEKVRLMAGLEDQREWFKVFVTVIMNTGLRPIELVTMEWVSVDLDRKEIRVRAGYSKTGKSRVILLNEGCWAILNQWKQGWDGLVFPRGRCPTGNPLMGSLNQYFANQRDKYASDPRGKVNQDGISCLWRAMMERIGIENLRMYDLRHNFASQLVMKGVDLYTVSSLLGHSDVKMTTRYAHLSPGHLRSAVNSI